MTFDIGLIRQQADQRLQQAPYPPKKLASVYAGAALGVSLVITLLDLLLLRSIDSTGGLSGLGARSVLETIRTLLQYALSLALPFWSFGFLRVAIAMARGGGNHPSGLLEGFRRFGPALRLLMLEGILYFAVAMISINIGSVLFYTTPMAAELVSLLEPLLAEGAGMEQMEAALAQIPPEQLYSALWPALAGAAILCVALIIPLHYRLRLADFFIMDEPKMGAVLAMVASSRCMKRNRLKWFRMELGFWWYYGLMALATAVYYGDVLLPLLGVSLPMDSQAAWLLFYVLGALVQFVLEWQCSSRIQTTYAAAYDILRQQPLFQPAQPKPENLPWDEYPSQDQPQ